MIVDIDISDSVGVTLEARVDSARQFHPKDSPRWDRELDLLAGQDVRVTVERWKTRSTPQNRLLWRTYREILSKLRRKYTDIQQTCPIRNERELHAMFRDNYLGTSEVVVLGKVEQMRGSTTKLTTAQFSRYLERVVAHAAEWEIYVQLPGDPIQGWGE